MFIIESMCTNTREYLETILKAQKANITVRPEDVSFWVVVTDRDLFNCLPVERQRYLISTPSEELVVDNSLTDFIDKRVFNDYYDIITEESQREIVSDDTVHNIGDSEYRLLDNRVSVHLSLLRTLTDKSVLVDVLDCTVWFLSSPDRLFKYLVQRYGNSIIHALVDLQKKGLYIRSKLDIVRNLTALNVMKMRLNNKNTLELMEKHEGWISDLQNELEGTISNKDSIHVIGFISELCFVLRLYRDTVTYDRYLHDDQVQLINRSIYRLNSTTMSTVLKHAFICVKEMQLDSPEDKDLVIELLVYIKKLVRRVRMSLGDADDFSTVIKKTSAGEGTFMIDDLLDLINASSSSLSSIQKEDLHILILSFDILKIVTYVPRSQEMGNEIVANWARYLQKWRNRIMYSTTTVLTKVRSILLVEQCSKIFSNVLLRIPEVQEYSHDFSSRHLTDEQISDELINCMITLINEISANLIECPLESYDRLLFSYSIPSSEGRSSFSLDTRSEDLSSDWMRISWLFNNNKDEYVKELKKRLLQCLKVCTSFDERNLGPLTRIILQKIVREVRQPALECILNISSEILDKDTVTEMTRLTFTLLIRIPKYLSSLSVTEENNGVGEMDAEIKPLIPRLLEFAIKHDNHAMAYLTMWYTSNYFKINVANLHQSVYLSNDYLKDVDSQNVIHSIEDFKREAGAIVTFLGKCANFEPSQHNLAMEKLFAHTKVVLNSIKCPRAQCEALVHCQDLWGKLSQIFLKVPFGSHAVGIFFDIVHEISRNRDKNVTSSRWRNKVIGIILQVSSSNGLQLTDIIRNSLHVHRISDRNKVCYLSVVKMLSSLVSGPPYFYPLFIDKQISLALLGGLKFMKESGQSFKNEEFDDVVAGTARILSAWGCNYPEDCLKAFDKTTRVLILQFDALEIREFYKRYLEEREHKCYTMTSKKEYLMRLFQFSHHGDCFQQWYMILFGFLYLSHDVSSKQFDLEDFLLNLMLFLLSFLSMIYTNYLSFEARVRHNRDTFTSDTVIWEGKQPDDGSTTLKSRIRYYLIPFSKIFSYNNVLTFLQMRLILDVKEILNHKPQLIRVLEIKIRNLSTLKLYLKLCGIVSMILHSLVIAKVIFATDTFGDLLPNKQDANKTIHGITDARDIFHFFSVISNSPIALKIELAIVLLSMIWSAYSTGDSLATYETNSSSTSERQFIILKIHHFVAILCRLILVNLIYYVSGTFALLFVGVHTSISLVLNLLISHKYHDPALDEEKQKTTPQRPILLALRRSTTWVQASSLLLRLLVFSISETLIVSVRHPIDMLSAIYHGWHEKTAFELAPTFILHIVELLLAAVFLQNSSVFIFICILNISSWILLVVYLKARTKKRNEWELKQDTFCDETVDDIETYGI